VGEFSWHELRDRSSRGDDVLQQDFRVEMVDEVDVGAPVGKPHL
jgi:hypothetical protein